MCNLNNVKLFLRNLILWFRIFKIFINVKVFLHHVNRTNPTGCFCHCFTREQILISYAGLTQLLLYALYVDHWNFTMISNPVQCHTTVLLFTDTTPQLHCCSPLGALPPVPCWPGPSSAGNSTHRRAQLLAGTHGWAMGLRGIQGLAGLALQYYNPTMGAATIHCHNSFITLTTSRLQLRD